MQTIEYTSVADIRKIVDSLCGKGSEVEVDLSCGDEHIREIADESGVEWETCHTSCNKFLLNGREVETWYDENASIYRCWNAFCKGIGTKSSDNLEEALHSLLEKMRETI